MEATDAWQEGLRAGERRMSNEDVADTKEDRMSDAAMISKTGGSRQSGDYAALQSVLDEAFLQSAEGKGNARHANDKPFDKQPILEIGRMVGPGFAAGQIMKKAQEAIGMAARGETEAAANELLGASGLAVAGFMVAVLAVMETPAILSGLMLARRGQASAGQSRGELLREVFLNASVVLLLGSFAIGLIASPKGYAEVQPLFEGGFKGVLCLFLLDMGLIAARRLIDARALNLRLVTLAIAFPLFNGTLGVLVGNLIGLDAATAAALGVLCASASYIAVPAAMRLALPQADPGIYLTMSLSITFPFNILVGISLFGELSVWLSAR